MSSSTPAASPVLIPFARGTVAILAIWPALRMAVEGGWGGPESIQKRTWLASAVVDAFEEASTKNEHIPDAIYIEEMLLQVLADEFEVVLEDGSAQPVAAGIVRLWQEIHEGRVDGVERVVVLADRLRRQQLVVDEKDASDEECQWEDEEDEEESERETEATPELLNRTQDTAPGEPEVDEEGFTMVRSRGKGRR